MSVLGGMKVTNFNGVKVYNVSGQRSLATWLNPAKQERLRKDEEYTRRIELLQDLNFDTASSRMKVTPDGQYLIASGIYPPQIKVYELNELSMKCQRNLESEVIDFQILSDDYSKLAFLCADRSVCFHAKFGSYFSTRVPRMGRGLVYDEWSCDLLVAASSPDLYRLNLEQGRFLAPLRSQSPGINVVRRSDVHGLIAAGGDDGSIEFFDVRQKAAIGRIEAVGNAENIDQEVTALQFDDREGMLLATGTSSGQVYIYDLRSSVPVHAKDHMYGCPIVNITWHQSVGTKSRHLVTADSRVVRIWDPETGGGMTSIETPAGEINDVCVYPGSGLLLFALDSPRISSYFIPALGPAPKWCSFLENLTEELEENPATTIYDDFKFVTKRDLERLNLTNLLGSNLLRAYMHGFFIDYRLYEKAKALNDPFAYELYRQQLVQQKLDAERAARITITKKLPKINKEFAAQLLSQPEKTGAVADRDGHDGDADGQKETPGTRVLADDRFSAMFNDEAFQIDEDAAEFRVFHPNAKKKSAPVDEYFDVVSEEDEDKDEVVEVAVKDSDLDHVPSDAGNSDRGRKSNPSFGDRHGDGQLTTSRLANQNQKNQRSKHGGGPRLHEVKDDAHAEAFRNNVSIAAAQRLSMEERLRRVEKTPQFKKHGSRRGLRASDFSFDSVKSKSDGQDDGFQGKGRGRKGKREGKRGGPARQRRRAFH